MEMHDSYLKDWACDEHGSGYALFHACIHRAEDDIFEGPGHESGWQGVRFDFEGMSIDGTVDFSADTYLSHGDLWIDSKHERNIVYLPANHAGEILMELCVSPVFDIGPGNRSGLASRQGAPKLQGSTGRRKGPDGRATFRMQPRRV